MFIKNIKMKRGIENGRELNRARLQRSSSIVRYTVVLRTKPTRNMRALAATRLLPGLSLELAVSMAVARE